MITDIDNLDSETARVTRRNDLPLLDYPTAVERAKNGAMAADVAVSFVFWKIIKQLLSSAPEHGIVNFLPAPLPDYPGYGRLQCRRPGGTRALGAHRPIHGREHRHRREH